MNASDSMAASVMFLPEEEQVVPVMPADFGRAKPPKGPSPVLISVCTLGCFAVLIVAMWGERLVFLARAWGKS